jgi:hypothetical protein
MFFELNWVNIRIKIWIRLSILYSYLKIFEFVSESRLKYGNLWYSNLYPCVFDLFPPLFARIDGWCGGRAICTFEHTDDIQRLPLVQLEARLQRGGLWKAWRRLLLRARGSIAKMRRVWRGQLLHEGSDEATNCGRGGGEQPRASVGRWTGKMRRKFAHAKRLLACRRIWIVDKDPLDVCFCFSLTLVQISSKPAARSTFHWRFPLSNVSERNRWARL